LYTTVGVCIRRTNAPTCLGN